MPLLVPEEAFVHFLQIECLINTNTGIVPNHQGGKAFSINKYDLEWILPRIPVLYAFAQYSARGGFSRPGFSVQREAARPSSSAACRERESAQAAQLCRNIAGDLGNDDRHYTLARQLFCE